MHSSDNWDTRGEWKVLTDAQDCLCRNHKIELMRGYLLVGKAGEKKIELGEKDRSCAF